MGQLTINGLYIFYDKRRKFFVCSGLQSSVERLDSNSLQPTNQNSIKATKIFSTYEFLRGYTTLVNSLIYIQCPLPPRQLSIPGLLYRQGRHCYHLDSTAGTVA